jgi:hypothetical protein
MHHKIYIFITVLLISSIITNAFAAVPARYVKPVATGTGDGSSWANASGNLQAMIQASSSGDEVWVAAGTYMPTNKPYDAGVEISTADARDVTFHVKDGVKLYGGFAGTETALNQRLITTNVTTLSGDIGTVGFVGDNAYHVVLASAASSGGIGVTIDGFTITGGNANSTSGSISVNSNLINRLFGGGIFIYAGTNTINNNTLLNNFSVTRAAGIYSSQGTNMISNNTLLGNATGSFGGGIYTSFCTNTITNNTFLGNSAGTNGGGVFLSTNTNNTISNNTFLGNSAGTSGGGVSTNTTVTFKNNIFWDNKKGSNASVPNADYYKSASSTVTFTNNLMQLAQTDYTAVNNNDLGTATGNIFNTNPLFVNATDIDGADNIHRTADDGLRLLPCSPAINVGDQYRRIGNRYYWCYPHTTKHRRYGCIRK